MKEALQAKEGSYNLGGGQHSTCEDAWGEDTEGKGGKHEVRRQAQAGAGAVHRYA